MINSQSLQTLISMQKEDNKLEKGFIREVNVFLDIDDPILVSYEDYDGVHILYMLEHLGIPKTYKFLKIESDYGVIEDVLNERVPLLKIFSEKMQEVFLDLRNKKTELLEMSLEKADELKYLPQSSFYLEKKYPNRIDLDEAKEKIKFLRENFDFKQDEFDTIVFEKTSVSNKFNDDWYHRPDVIDNQFSDINIEEITYGFFDKNHTDYSKRMEKKLNENRTKKIQN